MPFELAELLRSDVFDGAGVPAGNGQPVMLICGLLTSDETLAVLAGWLKRCGYEPVRGGILLNVDCSEQEMRRLERRLTQAHAEHGQKVLIIGHSRGGLFGAALACRHPDKVAGLITLGTPHIDPLDSMHPLLGFQVRMMAVLGDLGLGRIMHNSCRDGECCKPFWATLSGSFPDDVPFVSIFSRSDGVVRWRSCLHPEAEHVQVSASHCGMAAHRQTYEQIAEALGVMLTRQHDHSGDAATQLALAA